MDYETAEQKVKLFLAKEGKFFTRERKKILQEVIKTGDHFSADEMLLQMKSDNVDVSRATLYRALAQLVQAGVLSEADFGHGHAHYEVADEEEGNHGHIICKKCNKVVEIRDPELASLFSRLCAREGFEVDSFQLQLFGHCSDCK
jgi:Fur family transcriptional regulator, ferric uptake regulator